MIGECGGSRRGASEQLADFHRMVKGHRKHLGMADSFGSHLHLAGDFAEQRESNPLNRPRVEAWEEWRVIHPLGAEL